MGQFSRGVLFGIAVFLSGSASSSAAFFNLTTGSLSALTDGLANELIKIGSIVADHRPYSSARPLGGGQDDRLGLDIGGEVSIYTLPKSFRQALEAVGTSSALPTLVPFGKVLNVRYGFTHEIDAGVSWAKVGDNEVIGADVNWAFRFRHKRPHEELSWSLRAGMTVGRLLFMRTHTYSLDVVTGRPANDLVSWYLGTGVQYYSGTLSFALSGLPIGVNSQHSGSAFRIFGGIPIQFLLAKITPEVSYSFAGVASYGVKVALTF